jgi:hypothetical protein
MTPFLLVWVGSKGGPRGQVVVLAGTNTRVFEVNVLRLLNMATNYR